MVLDRSVEEQAASEAFRPALRDLYLAAGEPSARSIARELDDISHTTVADLLNGRRIPSWAITRRVIAHLGGDEARFQHLWGLAVEQSRDAYVASRDIVVHHQNAARAEEAAVPRLLPRAVPEFIGREEELATLASLAGEGRRVVLTAIGGTAGVGKTALAIQAAHMLVPRFPDGQLYVDLRGYTGDLLPAEPGEVLGFFLQQLGVPTEEIPMDAGLRSGMLRNLLASRRVLILLDNAASETQIRPLLPGTGGSLVLVTSRSAMPSLEADARLTLSILSPHEAVTLLAGIIGSERAAAEPDAAARVAELCGGLPLALRIAGAMLAAHPSWPVSELEQMLTDEQHRLGRLAIGDRQVRAAFLWSYQHLSGEVARMFRLLGLHPGPDFDATAAAALTGTGLRDARLSLARLTEAHLLTEVRRDRFIMHDLLRSFAREICLETDSQDTRDAAEEALIRHYSDLARFLGSCIDPRQRPEAERARRQLLSPGEALEIFQAELPDLLAATDLATRRGQDETVWQLSEATGDALTLLYDLRGLLASRESALAAARRAGNTLAESTALSNLGVVYRDLRRLEEAVGCHQESLVICRETGDRYTEARALSNLGVVYRDLRRLEEAVGCHQESLVICRETGDRYTEARALSNLGVVYRDLRRLEEAVGCHQESLVICRETGDRYTEARALSNLGVVYRDLRRLEEAVGCHQESLVICRETGDRYTEAWTLRSLGSAFRYLQRFADAASCYERSLAIFRIAGDRHNEGRALDNLGTVYRELQQPDRAAASWMASAAAMLDVGDHEAAARLEQLAANAAS